MPRYIDSHKAVSMPPEQVQKLVADIKAGRSDQFGAKPINMFTSKSETWCLAEAPSAEAVRKSHEALGLKLGPGDIVEVTTLV